MKKSLKNSVQERLSFLLAGFLLASLSSCYSFRIAQVSPRGLDTLSQSEKNEKYFVLHAGPSVFVLNDLAVQEKKITGYLNPPDRPIHYYPGRRKSYSKRGEKSITREVHVFLDEKALSYEPYSQVEIPVREIDRIEVIDQNTGAVVASYVGFILGVPLILFGGFLFFIVVLFSSLH